MSRKIRIKQPDEVRQQMEARVFTMEYAAETSEMASSDARVLAQAIYRRATCVPQHRAEAQKEVIRCLYSAKSVAGQMSGGTDDQVNAWNGANVRGSEGRCPWDDLLKEALRVLFGDDEAETLSDVLKLRMGGPVSEAIFRTPFHSSNPNDYLEGVILPTICRWIHGTGCPVTVEDCVTRTDLIVPPEFDLANRLALEFSRGNQQVVEAVEVLLAAAAEADCVKCERSERRKNEDVSREIIQAIVRSGNERLIGRLKELMTGCADAIKSGEQIQKKVTDILLSADEGSVETFTGFLQLICDEKLYAIPEVGRVMDTWLWLGCGALEPELAEAVLNLCLELLECDPALEQGQSGQNSCGETMLLTHLRLWAAAVHDRSAVGPVIRQMLRSKDSEQVISAIYFINNVEHKYLDFSTAVELLENMLHGTARETEEEINDDLEVLAWLVPNLIPQDLEEQLSDSVPQRQKLFSLLETAVLRIEKEERTFTGKPFPWTIKGLNCELVCEAMLRMARACRDRSMIRSLGRLFDRLTPKQRAFYYEYVLDPLEFQEDDFFLQAHRDDRSVKNRHIVESRLEWVREQKR